MSLVSQTSQNFNVADLDPFTGVDNGSARLLKAISATELAILKEGDAVYVISVIAYWKWLPNSTATDDTATEVTICAPTAVGVGPGRFVRIEDIQTPEVMTQTEWHFSSAGDNENTGLPGSPLLTTRERARRMGPNAIWLANTAYHLRYLTDGFRDFIQGFTSTNTALYVHATVNDREGDLFFSGVATTFTALNTATNTRQQITSATVPVSWTASALVGKRLRMTSGPAANAVAWVVRDMGGAAPNATGALDEMLIPAASLSAAPFAAPAATVTNGANGNTFVVETLRAVTLTFDLHHIYSVGSSPNSSGKIVLDSLDVNIFGSYDAGIYVYGCRVASTAGYFTIFNGRCNRYVSIGDMSTRFNIVGGSNSAIITLKANSPPSGQSVLDHFTIEGSLPVLLAGTVGFNRQVWLLGQIGCFNNAANQGGIYSSGTLVDINYPGVGIPTVLYGNGNAGPLFVFASNGFFRVNPVYTFATQPFVTAFASHFAGVQNLAITVTSLPALDETTGIYTAPRLMTFANIDAAVVAGGFGQQIFSAKLGAGLLKV